MSKSLNQISRKERKMRDSCLYARDGGCQYYIKLPYLVTAMGDTPLDKPEEKYVGIDKCLLPEILELWEKGVRTVGLFCIISYINLIILTY